VESYGLEGDVVKYIYDDDTTSAEVWQTDTSTDISSTHEHVTVSITDKAGEMLIDPPQKPPAKK
jgi:hypothetical protein